MQKKAQNRALMQQQALNSAAAAATGQSSGDASQTAMAAPSPMQQMASMQQLQQQPLSGMVRGGMTSIPGLQKPPGHSPVLPSPTGPGLLSPGQMQSFMAAGQQTPSPHTAQLFMDHQAMVSDPTLLPPPRLNMGLGNDSDFGQLRTEDSAVASLQSMAPSAQDKLSEFVATL